MGLKKALNLSFSSKRRASWKRADGLKALFAPEKGLLRQNIDIKLNVYPDI